MVVAPRLERLRVEELVVAVAGLVDDAEVVRVVDADRQPVWIPNLQPDFNVSVIERFGPDSFAVLRELDKSNRFVQKSAESTSI